VTFLTFSAALKINTNVRYLWPIYKLERYKT